MSKLNNVIRIVLMVCLVPVMSGCALKERLIDQRFESQRTEALESLLEEGEAAYRSGDYPTAKARFQKLLDMKEDHIQALYRLGNIAFRERDTEKSRRYFSKVVELNPRYAKAHYNLAVVHLMLSEEHFKYYTATEDNAVDVTSVVDMLSAIEDFATGTQQGRAGSSANQLDKLADKLIGGE